MFKKINIKIIILLVVFSAAFCLFSGESYASSVGQPAPAINATDLSSTNLNITFQGSVTVLNFWATWCPPCREEMPEMEAFFKDNAGKINFYAVNLQEPANTVRNFISNNGYTMPVLLDSGNAGRAYRISAIPTTIIVGSDGIVKFRHSGTLTMQELQQAVNSIN